MFDFTAVNNVTRGDAKCSTMGVEKSERFDDGYLEERGGWGEGGLMYSMAQTSG